MSVDDTGWTIQSDVVDLRDATVKVIRRDQELPVAVEVLAGGIGSTYALRIVPQGWGAEPGAHWVTVETDQTRIDYLVNFVDCEA